MSWRLPLLFVALFSLGACGTNEELDYVVAPDIDFECAPNQSHHCGPSGAGKVVYIGLSLNSGFDCESELAGLDPDLFHQIFDYSGRTIAFDQGTHLWGIVTQWANSAGAKAVDFVDDNYKLCAFLDSNDDGQLSSLEVLATEDFNPSQEFYPVSSWLVP